jgi:hypothetical protein
MIDPPFGVRASNQRVSDPFSSLPPLRQVYDLWCWTWCWTRTLTPTTAERREPESQPEPHKQWHKRRDRYNSTMPCCDSLYSIYDRRRAKGMTSGKTWRGVRETTLEGPHGVHPQAEERQGGEAESWTAGSLAITSAHRPLARQVYTVRPVGVPGAVALLHPQALPYGLRTRAERTNTDTPMRAMTTERGHKELIARRGAAPAVLERRFSLLKDLSPCRLVYSVLSGLSLGLFLLWS